MAEKEDKKRRKQPLYDVLLERRILKALCYNGSLKNKIKARSALIERANESWFTDELHRKMFHRFNLMRTKRNVLVSWNEFFTDPSLSCEERDRIRNDYDSDDNELTATIARFKSPKTGKTVYLKKFPVVKTEEEAVSCAELLQQYALKRELNLTLAEYHDKLNSENIESVEDFTAEVNAELIKIQQKASRSRVWRDKSLKSTLEFEKKEFSENPFLKTGFKRFDEEMGGLPAKGLSMLAAPTGSGKSSLAMQIALNRANAGDVVYFINLEMTGRGIMERRMANFTGMELKNIQNLTPKQRRAILRKMHLHNKKNDYGEIITESPSNTDIVSMVSAVGAQPAPFRKDNKTRRNKVLIIDYTALAGMNSIKSMGDAAAEWQTLKDVNNYLATACKQYNMTIISLAQAKEDGSYGIAGSTYSKQACDLVLVWKKGAPFAVKGKKGYTDMLTPLALNVIKSRNSASAETIFPVIWEGSRMRIRDASEKEMESAKKGLKEAEERENNYAVRGKSSKPKYTEEKKGNNDYLNDYD